MKKVIISIALLTAISAVISCDDKKQTKVLTKEVTFKKEGELQIRKAVTDSLLIKLDIEIAEGEYETQTGLMYRKSMLDQHAMLFIFETEIQRSFYMKNTEFALDILFINANKEVVSIQKNTIPRNQTSLPSGGLNKYVLEINAGLSDQWGIEPGDILSWSRSPK